MLKGVAELNQFFTEWLIAHDFDCVAELGNDFQFDRNTNTLYYALIVPQAHDDLFLDLCREYKPEIVNCDNFLLSFFHELGHYETEEDFTDKEWNYYYRYIVTTTNYTEYYKYPIEWEATKWGCDYIVNNAEEIAVFCAEYAKKIENFLKINDFEE